MVDYSKPEHFIADLEEAVKPTPKPKPPPPPPPTDPRVIPCKVGDQVNWKGTDYECFLQNLRDGRYRTYWGKVKEQRTGYNPETGRIERDQGALVEFINQAITVAVHAALAVAIAPFLAPLIEKIALQGKQAAERAAELTRLAPVFERAEAEYNRIKGALDTAGIATSVRTLKTIHRIASLTSEAYRSKIDQWTREVGSLSRRVFGRVDTVTSALALMQMAIYDTAALQGKSAEQAQSEYLDRAVNLGRRIESNARRYAQAPATFWADVNRLYLDPYLAERVTLGANEARLVSRLDRGLETLTEASTALSDRFTDYQRELEPFLGEGKLAELDAIRRNFDRDIRQPLTEIEGWFRDVWPEQAEVLAGTVEIVEILEDEVEDIQGLIPYDLDQAAAVAQRRRRVWAYILDDTLTPESEFPTSLPPVSARIESAYKRLLGE